MKDLNNGICPLEEEELTAEDAWETYRLQPQFDGVVFGQFKHQLKAHRAQVIKKQNKKRGREALEENWVDWRRCEGRAILLEDLHNGICPLTEDELSAEEAWLTCYVNLPEFGRVGFEQFKKQLKAHRQQVMKKHVAAVNQGIAFQHDRQIYPEALYYDNGLHIFRHSPAYQLLVSDVENGLHDEMTPKALHATRPEYLEWDLNIFRQRIYQTVRQKKYINYLELKNIDNTNKVDDEEDDTDDNGEDDNGEDEDNEEDDDGEDDDGEDDDGDGRDDGDDPDEYDDDDV